MALNLDARQRAMLQDMGITLWVPTAPPAAAQTALSAIAPAAAPTAASEAAARTTPEVATTAPTIGAPQAPAAPELAPEDSHQNLASERSTSAQAAPASEATITHTGAADAPAPHTAPVYRAPAAASAPWYMAPLVHAFADTATGTAPDAGWLVLVECADPADPWAGEAGTLLHNMLRALRLQLHPQVRIAPLTRQAPDATAGDSALEPLAPALHTAITAHRPARVLVLGLHAARAVLQRSEALGPLRAQVHQLHGVPTVVSYDPAYLLRAAHAKPGAWADLCRAHALQPPAP